MLVCAIFYRSWASWAFMLSSAGVMVTREAFEVISVATSLHNLPRLAILGGRYDWLDLLGLAYPPLVFASQSCIIVLLVLRWQDHFSPKADLRMSAMMLRSGGLAVITSLPWVNWSVWHRVWSYISH